jgi:hypothetical protein
MRRLRRASVIAALALLTSAATAQAECAWVLWQQGAIVTGSSVTETYDPVGAHQSQKECEAIAQGMERKIQQPASGYTKTVEGLYTKKSFSGTLVVHGLFKCLPDSIDRRGPRGK